MVVQNQTLNLISLFDMLSIRIENSKKYLYALSSAKYWDWKDQYNKFLERKLTLAESMVLVHPMFYEDEAIDFNPRGNRYFSEEIITSSTLCQSDKIWGYACETSIGTKFHGDHLWPYSLGGPTISDNKALLCDTHNLMKGNDIHFYPWELGLPSWFNMILETINRFINKNY